MHLESDQPTATNISILENSPIHSQKVCANCECILDSDGVRQTSDQKQANSAEAFQVVFEAIFSNPQEISSEAFSLDLCPNCETLLEMVHKSYFNFMKTTHSASTVFRLLGNSNIWATYLKTKQIQAQTICEYSATACSVTPNRPIPSSRFPTKRKVLNFASTEFGTPKRVKLDHGYTKKTTPRTEVQNLNLALARARSKFKKVSWKSKRQMRRILALSTLMKCMKKEVGEKKAERIRTGYSTVLKELIESSNKLTSVKKPCGIRYTENMKKFAVTLHFYSPKAYNFLRKHISLPHESSLVAWMSASNCGPGFNQDVIARLADARILATNNCLDDIILQLDEMAIKKDTPWCPRKHQFVGTIDYGSGCDLIDPPLASNALVILVVGLTGGWKVPIGYVFTNKVSGEVQHNLISKSIHLMSEKHFVIHAVVGDGNNPNVSMFKKFGVNESLDMLNSKFDSIPDLTRPQDIYAIYDIVHMMKLWRNLLHNYKIIFWNGNPIKWMYFEFLEQLQDFELIRAANKLSPQHIHFENNKMRVKLAVQIFSSSVADAIDFCREDLNLHQFKGSEHTTKFIRLLNSAFDIFNSRHPKQPGYKSPLNISNFLDRKNFLLHVCHEIRQLTTGNRRSFKRGKPDLPPIPLWQSPRKRAVLGFTVTAQSIIAISEKVLLRQEHPVKFVLTYRFCQDLIELLFNKIRGRLGGNNNPNVIEFENIMKRIWHQNLLKSTSTGNCIIQMEETEIPGGLLPLARPKKTSEDLIDYEMDSQNYLDEPDIQTQEYSLFYANCLVYIAGNVVKSIQHKIKCKLCMNGLFETMFDPLPSDVKKLVIRKNLGNLIFASHSVFSVIKLADKEFRKYSALVSCPTTKNLDFKITQSVILKCRDAILFPGLCIHFMDFDPFDTENHETVLIKTIVSQFLKIRLFDYGRRYRRYANVNSKRQTHGKSILFRNE